MFPPQPTQNLLLAILLNAATSPMLITFTIPSASGIGNPEAKSKRRENKKRMCQGQDNSRSTGGPTVAAKVEKNSRPGKGQQETVEERLYLELDALETGPDYMYTPRERDSKSMTALDVGDTKY